MAPAVCPLVADMALYWVRGRLKGASAEVTDKPATPWSVAAILPGSGVAQLGTTPSGQTLSGDEEQGSELLTLLSVRVCKLLCPWAPLKGPLHIIQSKHVGCA